MTPAEELELLELEAEALRGKKLPPQGRSVLGRSKEMQSYRPSWANKDEDPGLVEQTLGGAKHAWDRASQGVAGMFGGTAVSPEQLAAGKAFVAETGPASTGGQLTTDLGMGLAPGGAVLKGGRALYNVMKARKIGGAGTAMVGADIAGNAGVSAALAPEDRDEAAMWGGGAAVGGRVLARTLGGPLRPAVTPEAKTLLDQGVQLTPGQMVAGPDTPRAAQMLRNFEDSMQSYPIAGDVIRHGRLASTKSWNIAEINQALEPIGARVTKGGRNGIDAAEGAISTTYDKILPYIKVPQVAGLQVITDAPTRAVAANPLFDVAHAQKLEMFIDRRMKPLIDSGDVNGALAKKLDAELGELARKYEAGGVGNEPLGDAFAMLRKEWRAAMEGTTPDAKLVLQNANTAFAKLVSIKQAAQASNSGYVTPGQLRQATNKLRQPGTATSLAARDILPDSIPDSGTAGRLLLHNLLTPAGVSGAGVATAAVGSGGIVPAAALAAAMSGMYTKAGSRYMSSGGEDILNGVLKKLRQQPMSAANLMQIEEITRLLGTQSGRALSNTGE